MPCPTIASWNIRGFNTPQKVFCSKNMVSTENLDMLCLLENRILPNNLDDPWFSSSHRIFENEDSFHNFDCAVPGRIWLKWDYNKISFTPSFSSSQLITGVISSNTFTPFLLSVVYASNSFSDRFNLWQDLCSLDPKDSMPWVIMGDFNCCRFQSDKAGGNAIPTSKLAPFNNFIFEANLSKIPSSGIFHTWYNQRTENPIHIRLDRMLANDSWFTAFPSSSYKVKNSLISDHSPLILKENPPLQRFPRFLYKNYWNHLPDFWNVLLEVFDRPIVGNPIIWLYNSLKMLKCLIKRKGWSSSNHILDKCKSLAKQQSDCQVLLDSYPLNANLCCNYKKISKDLDFYLSSWTSWMVQRGKLKWLAKGEDDLKFLYSRIKRRNTSNSSALSGILLGQGSCAQDNINNIISHFKELFNAPPPASADLGLSGWKAKLLSFAGKVQFIRYTITNIIVYWLRGALIPKTIIKTIGKNCSNFLYFSGGGSQGKRLHLISWSNTCKPVSKGGLGIAYLPAIRFVINCDIISRFYNSPSLLSIWLRARYISPWRPCSNPDSALWKNICSTAYSIKHNFHFSINTDSPASIYWDHWCSGTQLSSIIPEILRHRNRYQRDTISDWILNSNWNAPSSLGAPLATYLSSVPISSAHNPHIFWKDKPHPKFKDFYNGFFDRDLDVEWHHYVWHKKKCLRYSVFSWLAFKGGLKTVDALARRNITVSDPVCPLCLSDMESLKHIFFDCNYSFSVISSFLPSFQSFYLRPSLSQAFQHVSNLHETKVVKRGLLLTLNAIIYHLWRERNNRRFNSTSICTVSIAKLISKAIKFKLSSWKYKEYLLEKLHLL
ncbi:hypothetical protein M5K25_002930 [Dendrobium thyrsiflorum]|uniref:Reverse transcriptase zinc-binding domain-containing protein n=1 Tax=Dendrobium thyrsiflorum TaxID=117978 RepID=A0ABD0VPI0_DENTH